MENVTEKLVRQNGNQAAAVMADFAGGGGSGIVVPELVNLDEPIGTISGLAAILPSLPKKGDCFYVPEGSSRLLPVCIVDIEWFEEKDTYGGACCLLGHQMADTFEPSIVFNDEVVSGAPKTLVLCQEEGSSRWAAQIMVSNK